MAKFRTNHSSYNSKSSGKRGTGSSKSTLFRSVFFFVGICIIIYFLTKVKSNSWDDTIPNKRGDLVELSTEKGAEIEATFLPESTTGQVVYHNHYTLSYHEEFEQAEWVAYKLTKGNLNKPRVKRAKKYTQDPLVSTLSAKHNDYTRSGYTRGHLVPAGDMAFSELAMKETFYMSNMSPQLKEFNGGIWRELEENVRDWARKDEELYIISGPLFKDNEDPPTIGYNEVAVPSEFYKIVVDLTEPTQKAIAFIIPNKKSTEPLSDYAVSIDEIELRTQIDFFAGFLPEELEQQLEAKVDVSPWTFDSKKFKTRINKWNNY